MFGRQVLWEIRNDLTAEATEGTEEEKRRERWIISILRDLIWLANLWLASSDNGHNF
jgi:hypothetical protein